MRRLTLLLSVMVVGGLLTLPAVPSSADGQPSPNPVTKGTVTIPDDRMLSAGGWAFFHGASTGGDASTRATAGNTPSFGTNVDANDPAQDITPGQAETAIAATTWGSQHRVLAAWNDAQAFFTKPSTKRNASATGVSISLNGGASFHDLIGLPNANPNQQWFGDPTIVAIDASHFIVGSLYLPATFAKDFCAGEADIAVAVATVSTNGSKVSFTYPIVGANGGSLCSEFGAFLDKPFLAYDRTTRTLALSYTNFGPPCFNGSIQMVRAAVPADPATLTTLDFDPTPVEVWPAQCDGSMVNAGSYPAVGANGDVVVAWEQNVFSNQFNGKPYVWIHAAKVPAGAFAPSIGGPANPVIVTTGQVNGQKDGGVKSLDIVQIVGFSRFVGQDFPRVAYNPVNGRFEIAWNDASLHPLGDIWLREMDGSLNLATSTIRRVNGDSAGALHFLPALTVRTNGTICISWYDRRRYVGDSAHTDYYRDCRTSAAINATDYRVTTGFTDWNATSSIINPNFGDYTDAASDGNTTYYIWTDGRTGYSQPFVDSSTG